MALLLNIDTAFSYASVSINLNGEMLGAIENNVQKEHAAFLQPAIKFLFEKYGYKLRDLDGISVVEGPGSYTGLRIGMATAKGLCYALQKPLITVGTLSMMTLAVIDKQNEPDGILFCPMIDARRMEVFTAVYDKKLKEILSPCAMILNPHSFDNYFEEWQILFFGDGADKWKGMNNRPEASFDNETRYLNAFNKIALQKFNQAEFADTTYCAPIYLKEFRFN